MDTYDHGYLPNDADCNQDAIRYALDCAHEFYAEQIAHLLSHEMEFPDGCGDTFTTTLGQELQDMRENR